MISFHKDCHTEITKIKNEVFDSGIHASSSNCNYCDKCSKYLNHNDIYHANGEYKLTTQAYINAMAESLRNLPGFNHEINGVKV